MNTFRLIQNQLNEKWHKSHVSLITLTTMALFLIGFSLPSIAQRGDEGHHVKGEKVNMHANQRARQEMKLERHNSPKRILRERPYARPDEQQRGEVVNNRENITVNNRIINEPQRNWPARGTVVNVLPSGTIFREQAGIRIGFNNGIFYRPYGDHFVVCRPPIGFRINFLPVGFISFSLFNTPYYYYGGIYYQRAGNEYVVVQPPLGALVQSIPQGGQQLIIDGNTYYIVDGVQYQAVIYNGQIWYKVIKVNNE
jgi:hypothetical protein